MGADSNINGGTLEVQGNLSTGGNVNVNPGSALVVDPPGSVNAGNNVNANDATVDVAGQVDAGGSFNLDSGTVLTVAPTGAVHTADDVNLNNSTAVVQGDLDAGGSVKINSGSAFVVDGTGSVIADDGVQVAGDAALILDGQLTTPTSLVLNGGGLCGSGVINGNVNNSGVVAPGDPVNHSTGTLTINGNYTQNADGALNVQAKSTTDFSKLVVNGNAEVAGTLQLTPLNGFQPEFGQRLSGLLQADSVSGSFGSVELPPGFRGRVEENDGNLTMLIAPASYTQVAQTRNQANVAAALDQFILATRGDRLVVSTALIRCPLLNTREPSTRSCRRFTRPFQALGFRSSTQRAS